ncbi:MAG: hypothetical protein UC390_09165, partial [Peptococcaceae bacterium]|nr:hypothetical protein [Peptococcaceae bacterium]
MAVAEDGDGWGVVFHACGTSCALAVRTCGAPCSRTRATSALQLSNAFVDLREEGLPVGFGAVGAGGAAVP